MLYLQNMVIENDTGKEWISAKQYVIKAVTEALGKRKSSEGIRNEVGLIENPTQEIIKACIMYQ